MIKVVVWAVRVYCAPSWEHMQIRVKELDGVEEYKALERALAEREAEVVWMDRSGPERRAVLKLRRGETAWAQLRRAKVVEVPGP